MSINWTILLQPLIETLIKMIIEAILKAFEDGEFAKAITAIDGMEQASRFEGFKAAEELGKIAKSLLT